MFVVSFHEQNLLFKLHPMVNGKFEHYKFTTDGDNKITSARPAIPVNQLIIYGYMSKNNQEIGATHNIYYGDHFAVMEIDDKTWEHLMSEWGSANPTLKNGIIFGEKKQSDAIAKAKARTIGGGLSLLDTGARPLSINNAYKMKQNFPNMKKLNANEMIA